jgi:hypothetical protein
MMKAVKHKTSVEPIIETMIGLARCSRSHRIILSGSDGPHQMFELHRRGFHRVATMATCGLPRGQYDAAFVNCQRSSIKSLETTLNWLVHFLAWTSVVVIWIESTEHSGGLVSMFERLGFRIEAGTRCERGLAICARRLDANSQAIAA